MTISASKARTIRKAIRHVRNPNYEIRFQHHNRALLRFHWRFLTYVSKYGPRYRENQRKNTPPRPPRGPSGVSGGSYAPTKLVK